MSGIIFVCLENYDMCGIIFVCLEKFRFACTEKCFYVRKNFATSTPTPPPTILEKETLISGCSDSAKFALITRQNELIPPPPIQRSLATPLIDCDVRKSKFG
jgi:hypothetical protein